MTSKTGPIVSIVFVAVVLVSCCGCPDTSYQAPLPDYSNMKGEGAYEDGSAAGLPSDENG